MRYNPYTPQSPLVSEIGLGAWQLGQDAGWRNMTETAATQMVHKALELGLNFFDTAPNYGLGTSEARLGKALKGYDRSKIVVNTKFGHTVEGTTNFRADNIRTSLEGSLQRLQLDYVDSLIIHNPPHALLDGGQNPHYDILERLKEEGKIKAYGASLDTYEEMKLFMETTGGEVIEAFFNMLHQDTGRAFELAQQKGVGIIVKIPLDSGWLSGKYNAESTFQDVRSRWSSADIRKRANLVDRLREIIPDEYKLPQAAIAFCLAQQAVATVIPGSTTIDQLKSNLASTRVSMPPSLVDELRAFYQEEVRVHRLPW